MALTANESNIFKLVAGLFNGAPGKNIQTDLSNIVAAGTSLSELANILVGTLEFQSIVPAGQAAQADFLLKNFGFDPAATDDATTVAKAFVNDNFGLGLGQLAYLAVEFLNTTTDPVFADAAALLNNKALVAGVHADNVDAIASVAAGQAAFVGVTASGPTTAEAALALLEDNGVVVPEPGQTGDTFKLTTGTDELTGTPDNDTFNATYDGTTASTFNVSDILDGGSGADVLNITATDDAVVTLPSALVSGIETVNIRNVDGDATPQVLTVNASNFVGATAFNADRATDSVTFSNLATDAAIGVIGNGAVVGGAVAAGYATTTDAVTLNIAGGTKMINGATVTGTATSATINSTGAANTIGTVNLASASLTSVTINAATDLKGDFLSETTDQVGTDGAVTISGAATSVEFTAALDNTIKTIDASGLTAGGVKAAVGTGTEDIKGGAGVDTITLNTGVKTATFGAGDDVVTTAAVTATAAGAIKGGGGTDTLAIAAASDVNTAAKRAVYSEFEVLRNKAAGAALDMDGFTDIVAVESEGAIATTFSNLTATQAGAVKVIGAATTLNLGLKDGTGSADVATVTLGDTKTDSDIMTELVANKFETINVVSAGTKVGSDATVEKITSDTATKVNISGSVKDGSNALFKLNDTSGLAKAVTIDASGITDGALTLGAFSGSLANGSSVIGTAGKDTITLGTGFGTYNSGAGDDTFNATAAQLNTGSLYNEINGGEGTDTLNITGGAALNIVDNNLSKLAGIEKIVVATTADNDQSIQTGGFFDNAFKTTGVDLTTTAGKGDIAIDMTSFTGAATLSVTTAGTIGGEGAISVQTGSGADTITVSAAVNGDAGVVKTQAGNDKITTTGTEDFTITAGAGDDTIILNSAGDNTVVFEATAALNGVDTITGFNKTTDVINWVQGVSEVAVTGSLTTTADAFYQLGGLAAGKADSAAEAAAAVTAAATSWTAAAATAWIAVSDTDSTSVYQWTDVAGTNGVQEAELTLVGTIDAAMSTVELGTAITIV